MGRSEGWNPNPRTCSFRFGKSGINQEPNWVIQELGLDRSGSNVSLSGRTKSEADPQLECDGKSNLRVWFRYVWGLWRGFWHQWRKNIRTNKRKCAKRQTRSNSSWWWWCATKLQVSSKSLVWRLVWQFAMILKWDKELKVISNFWWPRAVAWHSN